MLYVSIKRTISAVSLCLLLSTCAGIDPQLNPFYKGDEENKTVETDRSVTRSPERRSIDSIVRTRDEETSSDADFSSLNSQKSSVSNAQHAQDESILLSAGPNPYLATAQPVNAYANEQYSRAAAAMDTEEWRAAEDLLAQLTARQPELSSPWLKLGLAQMKQEKLAEAQRSFEKAIESNKANQEAYNQLALLHRKQGQFAKAEASYQKAIAVWPAYPAIRLNLGILYELYLGDLGKALQQYAIYQSLLPEPDRKVSGWISDLKRRLQVSDT